MKALVLSGGTGARLRPLTHSMPKQLVPLANKPVLRYCLETIRETGVTEVGIIVGRHAAEVAAALGDGSDLGLRLTYLHQEAPLGLAHCVLVAADFLGGEDFLMYLGDNMLIGGIAEIAEEFRATRPDAKVLVVKVPDPQHYGVAELDPDGRVLALAEKPAVPRSDLALMGVYFFTAAIHEAVRRIGPSARGELEITDAIQWLVEQGRPVLAQEYGGYWKDTGKVADLLECNRIVMDRLTADVRGQVDGDSVLTGAVVVEPGARVTGSRLTGPVVVAAGAVVRDSRVGPYTALARGSEVIGSWIEDSIVLDDASIRGVSGIHGSLIGRSAVVRTGDDRHRLLVGDHSRIEVAA